jgi:hypothetical protein
MRILTLAAGLAAGYVLGTRAGREKYEQIAATARKVNSHPTVTQAQEKAKNLLSTGTDAVTAKLHNASPDAAPVLPATGVKPAPTPRTSLGSTGTPRSDNETFA